MTCILFPAVVASPASGGCHGVQENAEYDQGPEEDVDKGRDDTEDAVMIAPSAPLPQVMPGLLGGSGESQEKADQEVHDGDDPREEEWHPGVQGHGRDIRALSMFRSRGDRVGKVIVTQERRVDGKMRAMDRFDSFVLNCHAVLGACRPPMEEPPETFN